MPLKNGFSGSFYSNYGNQVNPLLISNDGQIVWSEHPYEFEVKNDTIYVHSKTKEFIYAQSGTTLKEAI
ncbi:MAG: hypothetical protein J7K34_00145 [Flavobacteriaceae bacterium]|nr:hypothetical protein [Flavobacteriaceae bacterium]